MLPDRWILGVVSLTLPALVAACGALRPPPAYQDKRVIIRTDPAPRGAPVANTAPVTRGTPMPAAVTGLSIPGTHRVRKGDTVYAISRRYGVPVRPIIVKNGLEPPYALQVGQTVKLPSPRLHLVRKGDTLYSIARQHDVSVSQLVRQNGIKSPYVIKLGERLTLPDKITGKTGARARSAKPGAPSAKIGTAQAATPKAVARGQTARSGNGPAAKSAKTSKPARLAKRAEKQVARRSRPSPIPRPPPRAGRLFHWPVNGKLLSGFGAKGKGLHNDGINIAAVRGSAVRAAENGVVAYRGSELKEFGNLVLIRHAGGYITAYAHNEKLLVRRGQSVRRGQAIARVGSSGNVARPQLHFEIRRRQRPVNPLKYLARRQSAAR